MNHPVSAINATKMEHYKNANLFVPVLWATAIPGAYDNAVRHGFHDKEYSLKHLKMMIATEICKVIDADRNGRRVTKRGEVITDVSVFDEPFRIHFEKYIKDTVEDEFADIVIRSFDLLGLMLHDNKINMNKLLLICKRMPSYERNIQPGRTMTECAFDVLGGLTQEDLSITYFLGQVDAWAGYAGIVDIWTFIRFKMRYNIMRPSHNGKLY